MTPKLNDDGGKMSININCQDLHWKISGHNGCCCGVILHARDGDRCDMSWKVGYMGHVDRENSSQGLDDVDQIGLVGSLVLLSVTINLVVGREFASKGTCNGYMNVHIQLLE